MSCGTCSEKTKAGAAASIGSPVATGGASNVRHCTQCGGFLPKDGQCRKCATAGSDGVNLPRNSQERYPFWVQRWRELGDDMPCPECGEEQLETQDGITVCRACNWRAENQLAIDEFGHGVTEAVSAQAQDQGEAASFKLTAVDEKQWGDWVRQAKSSDTLFADDEYRPEALVINTQEAVNAVPQVLEEIAIAYKAHCDSCVVWINNPDDEVCIYHDHAGAVAQLAPQVGTTEDEWWDAVDEGIRGAAGRGNDTATISMWLPGGSMQSKTLAQAYQSVRECWDTPQGFYWERRESGVDPEETWNDGSHEYTTLRDVVTAALPHWKELGLTPEQAGLIAMETGLVVSTGVEIENEEAEETD